MGLANPAGFTRSEILRLSDDLPLVIEIVDGEDKISRFFGSAARRDKPYDKWH